jgi:glycosyltransferase involved in cell wall biosynthesis
MKYFNVLLPVKNGGEYFSVAVESVINQSFKDWTLLILDHGSSDGSFELAEQYALQDERIKVYSFPNADGLSELLNFGLDLCDCKFVLRQDADDISVTTRFQETYDYLIANPTVSLLGTYMNVIDGNGTLQHVIKVPVSHSGVKSLALFQTPFFHPTVAICLKTLRNLKLKYGICLDEAARVSCIPGNVKGLAEDYLLFGQMAFLCRCENLPKVLVHYRWHGGNVGSTRKDAQLNKANNISKYLSNFVASMGSASSIDPSPYTNHGNKLMELNKNFDEKDFFNLKEYMLNIIGDSVEFRREFGFREVLRRRDKFSMIFSYFVFSLFNGFRRGEFATVYKWTSGEFTVVTTLEEN